MESFNKNPRFVGLKFPEITKPETLEKRYMTSLSKKAQLQPLLWSLRQCQNCLM